MDNKTLTTLQRVFLWNQLHFTVKGFDLFGIDNAIDNALDVIRFDDKMKNVNFLKAKIDKLLKSIYFN